MTLSARPLVLTTLLFIIPPLIHAKVNIETAPQEGYSPTTIEQPPTTGYSPTIIETPPKSGYSPTTIESPGTGYAPNSGNDQDHYHESTAILKAIRLNLYNLGQYLGYSLGEAPSNAIKPDDLTPPPFLTMTQSYIKKTYIPAVTALTNLITLNIFKNYNNPSSSGTNSRIAINRQLDQQPYQTDPVNQSVLNLLTTPDYSYCFPNYRASRFKEDPLKNCMNTSGQKNNLKILTDVIGPLPSPTEFFNFSRLTKDNVNLIPQLSSNTLITPLLYSIRNTIPTSNTKILTASSQAEEAENFIRYATGNTNPVDLAVWPQYEALYTKSLGVRDRPETIEAQYILSQYLSSLRSFAAQVSVGVNNLYYILAKRMKTEDTNTSEALTEYNMATWRLANINKQEASRPETSNPFGFGFGHGPVQRNAASRSSRSSRDQWSQQIMDAPPETVQKEIALLLAEINYQMYLSRQQQERILMTNSMLLLQVTRWMKPTLTSSDQRDVDPTLGP